MYCPECRSEYVDGITVCPECEVGLIPALPVDPEPEFLDYREVMATYNPADIAFLKSLLDAERIVYFFKGEHFMYVRPLADPVRLMVRIDQVKQVRALLENAELSVVGISLKK